MKIKVCGLVIIFLLLFPVLVNGHSERQYSFSNLSLMPYKEGVFIKFINNSEDFETSFSDGWKCSVFSEKRDGENYKRVIICEKENAAVLHDVYCHVGKMNVVSFVLVSRGHYKQFDTMTRVIVSCYW